VAAVAVERPAAQVQVPVYMKRNFTTDEAKIIYKRLTQEAPGVDLRGFVSVGRFLWWCDETNLGLGGRRHRGWQRSSVMKLQYQYYWRNAGEDDARLKWLHDLYADIYSTSNVDPRYTSTPYPGGVLRRLLYQLSGCRYVEVSILDRALLR